MSNETLLIIVFVLIMIAPKLCEIVNEMNGEYDVDK